MFIVMHCMGMPFNGETIKGSSLGGSETAAYYMAKELAKRGHRVTLFTNHEQEGVWDGVKYTYAGHVTEANPLGDRFHFYASNTPHDVLIIQRHPLAFRFPWASKINLWWVHDLAQVRDQPEIASQMWNTTGILTVSEMHKKQYMDVYGINGDAIFPIQNGVDLSLFEKELVENEDGSSNYHILDINQSDQTKLLYTSRPERGLEHLVAPDGIMERLAKIDPKYHLYICAYNNVTQQMAPYYEYLYQRVEQLPNVTNLGYLTKQELADVMRQCDALVYPTPGPQQPNFEEVSCITAMECMAAGLPFISCAVGALPETCEESTACILLKPNEDGLPDIDRFVNAIQHYTEELRPDLKEIQQEAAKKFSWDKSADMLLGHIDTLFKKNRSKGAIARHLLEHSDIYALQTYTNYEVVGSNELKKDDILAETLDELNECYRFAFDNTWAQHYEAYYEYEKNRGVDYGPENLQGNSRFEHVSSIVGDLPSGITILDYGCAHGHYTINLAKRFPDRHFVGVDITISNVTKARQWANEEGLGNVTFMQGEIPQGDGSEDGYVELSSGHPLDSKFDVIIAAEVIEHVGDPAYYIDTLNSYLNEDGTMIITTPFGPWEAQGYDEHYPWRAHVWHFDRADLKDLWGHFPNYNVACVPAGISKWYSKLGSYVTTFSKPDEDDVSGVIDMGRKFAEIVPRQTVSLCMIVKDAESTLKKTLDSARSVADEIILAIDHTTSDRTREVIDAWTKDIKGNWPIVKTIDIDSPLNIGFDEARNKSIEQATGDWILWMDADEILIRPEELFKYLHNNTFEGYAIKQHHFTVEPLGVMKTDMPCRLFRNHRGVKFFGVVHEHPERAINEGVGHVQLLPDVEIAHQGYTTEAVRRARFERNIDLMVRDREKYPERKLGKFLWMRDLSLMCRFELQSTSRISPQMRQRAEEGIAIWEELLELGELRMLVDGLEFYDVLARVLATGFEVGFALDTSKLNGGIHLEQAKPVRAYFAKKEHAEKLFSALFDEKVKDYGSKYF